MNSYFVYTTIIHRVISSNDVISIIAASFIRQYHLHDIVMYVLLLYPEYFKSFFVDIPIQLLEKKNIIL